ncbi:MAG: ABC transporter ATP-binding protein [Luteibaculaceae bacterium]
MELKISALSVGYEENPILFEVKHSLTLPKGKITALMGSNGSGKSTLIKILAGVLNPLSGSVLVNNAPVSSYSLPALAQLRAVMFTGRTRMPQTTVSDFVEVALFSNNKLSSGQKKDLVLEHLTFTESIQFAQLPIDSLSDGQYQRVALARALVQQTPILILDEPTAFLDFEAMRFLFEKLMEISKKQHKTILISTHHIPFALNAANEIWLIKNKELISGSPEDMEVNGHFSAFTQFNLNPQLAVAKQTVFSLEEHHSAVSCYLERGIRRLGFTVEPNASNQITVLKEGGFALNKGGQEVERFKNFSDLYNHIDQHYA